VPDPGRFEDYRGVIEDLIAGRVDAVTRIFTRAGHVRGNHIHQRTSQWTFIVSGKLRTVLLEDDGPHESTREPGDFFPEPPGVPHAWEALEDTTVLVFTRGPRAAGDYESDTIRLLVPLITPGKVTA
jgi:quercetin dioxygenase-like cupin family protein